MGWSFQNKHNIPVAEHDSLPEHNAAMTENCSPQTGFSTQVSNILPLLVLLEFPLASVEPKPTSFPCSMYELRNED